MVKRRLNSKLFKEAKEYLVGGVNSPARAFNYVGGEPLLLKSGRGSQVYDYDGSKYIDYVISWGSLILGHAFPRVTHEVKKAIDSGLSFGTTNAKEIELARLIHKAAPFVDKIRLTNSGTEAVMGAVRLARGYTKRDKVLKFENFYHGHADYLLAKGGSGLTTLQIPASAGVPDDFIKDTLIIPFGDKIALEKVFKKYGHQIAAVLFEPVGGNYGVMPPNIIFLKYLRKITRKYGVLLIADEVITGFRFNFGSFSFNSGITPDLICLGKIIGGGLPIGAYGGDKEIMAHLAPLGKVYQASTFSGNPVVMQAGLATLDTLSKLRKYYSCLEYLVMYLAQSLKEAAELHGVNLEVSYFGSMFSFKFEKREQFKKFYRGMLERGIYFAPSEFEANFLSFAHTKEDIEKTITQAKLVLARIRKGQNNGKY